jgi:hypothetical protein
LAVNFRSSVIVAMVAVVERLVAITWTRLSGKLAPAVLENIASRHQ